MRLHRWEKAPETIVSDRVPYRCPRCGTTVYSVEPPLIAPFGKVSPNVHVRMSRSGEWIPTVYSSDCDGQMGREVMES